MRRKHKGRPQKEPKTNVHLRIRTTTLERYRKFLGPATIFQEAVEQAIKRQMEEAGFK